MALCTLVAALGFTPWIVNPGTPWTQFAFRVLGLGTLAAASSLAARGVLSAGGRAVRSTQAALVLLVVTALTAAMSVQRGKSLEAMLNALAILGLFLAAALLLRGARALRGLAVAEVLAAIPVAALGIAQHFRPDLVPAESSYPGRALGPLGQPNRLGGFVIATIPLALALAFAVPGKGLRAALLVAAFCLTLCLVYTYSRGSWIGVVAGLAALGAAMVRWPDLRPAPPLLALALLAVALPILLSLPSIASRVAGRPGGTTTANLPIDPEREGSASMRRAVWSGAFAAIAARPVVGWGVGTFREAFDRSKGATMKRLEAEGGRTADQAHSFYLETLTERGALGLLAFALFVGIALAGGIAVFGTGAPTEARLLSAGLIASLAALLVHALFEDNLSFLPHGVLLATNAGLLAAGAPGPKRAAGRGARWAGGIGVAAAALGVVVSLIGARAGATALQADREARSGNAIGAMSDYERASRLAPWDDRYAIGAAKAATAASALGDRTIRLTAAADAYRAAIAANPSDPVTRHELARLYLSNPDVFGDAGLKASIRELRIALEQNPYYAEMRNDLGVALLRSGDRTGAVKAFRKAAEGRRDFVDPLLNLAALSAERGDRAEAARWIDEALRRNPSSERAYAMSKSLPSAFPDLK
ncbi:MAG TPA: O-antigen ligase family protein [Candidatus Eisenbacteria bacterium]